MTTQPNYWKRCSSCRKEILFSTKYYLCSVSTCRHPRLGTRYCSVDCWDAHLGIMRHRDAAAELAVAPTLDEYLLELAEIEAEDEAAAMLVQKKEQSQNSPQKQNSERKIMQKITYDVDTLVVVSKVKQFIRDQSEGMNISQCCIDALTQKVCDIAIEAIGEAKEAGRKTVMGRDVK